MTRVMRKFPDSHIISRQQLQPRLQVFTLLKAPPSHFQLSSSRVPHPDRLLFTQKPSSSLPTPSRCTRQLSPSPMPALSLSRLRYRHGQGMLLILLQTFLCNLITRNIYDHAQENCTTTTRHPIPTFKTIPRSPRLP